ncbi:MAG: hypothetical protein HY514_02310 [Candidatus Aenigmarchaeota archaeon]|nr:hypothetical protein [Candidatus Aenigmarchaeota archaeon]
MKSNKREARKLGYDRPQALFAPTIISIKNPNSPDGLWGYVMKGKDAEIKPAPVQPKPYKSS